MPYSTMDSGRSLFPTTCVLTSMGSMLINWSHPLKWGNTYLGVCELMAVFKCIVSDWESVLINPACYTEFLCGSSRVLLV